MCERDMNVLKMTRRKRKISEKNNILNTLRKKKKWN